MSPDVLVVDDEPRFRALYTEVLTAQGLSVVEASSVAEARARIDEARPAMIVSDVRMPGASGLDLLSAVRAFAPDLPFLLVTAYADVRDAVAALKLGAVDYLSKPVDLDELVASVHDALGIARGPVVPEVPPELIASIVSASAPMQAVLGDAWRIARSDVNVLLTGESGAGKEVVARFIHRASDRAKAPCVAVNCAALPAELLSSELFGHERGAFTGAVTARKGRFREADGGVLFLDEIGDMPMALQPVMLRVLEQRTVTPVGGTGETPVDFRLIAATNCELEQAVAEGRFRADLYYRLNVIALEIPPLRERLDDIAPLARLFLKAAGADDKRLSRATLRAMHAYHWPGNVRELENVMRRAALLTRADVILPENLPQAIRKAQPKPPSVTSDDGVSTLQESEIAMLRRALGATGGNRTRAAELLGITRRGLLKKLKRFGLQGGPNDDDL